MLVTIGFCVIIFIYVLMMAISAIFVYHDAKKRSMKATVWAIITFFAPFLIGLIIYFICRTPLSDFACSNCGAPVEGDTDICPNCNTPLMTQCKRCQFPIQKGWKSCPKCGEELPEDYQQPVRIYQKESGIGIVVFIIVILFFLIVLVGMAGSISYGGIDYSGSSIGGLEGIYNITEEELIQNDTIAEWIKAADSSEEKIHVLMEKGGKTCLLYVKDSENLMRCYMDLTTYSDINGEEYSIIFNIEETEYEDLYGYHFFLYQFMVSENTKIDAYINGNKSDIEMTFTENDISKETWGAANESE